MIRLNIFLQLHPAIMMVIGLVAVALLSLALRPGSGLMAGLKRKKNASEKELLEDALKYLFNAEYRDEAVSVLNLKNHLDINSDKVSALIDSLKKMAFVSANGDKLELTDAGRSYALRIIRVHRVWETYFANETGVKPKDWHEQADVLEHSTSFEEAEQLAASIGNPVFDPHGDPIPAADGSLPEQNGQPLHEIAEGENVVITHIEDEPKIIYDQLLAIGMYPGMPLYIMDKTGQKIVFMADGDEEVLTPQFAAQITVRPVVSQSEQVHKEELLSNLQVGQKATVTGISPHCRGQQRRRLMDLGIVPGSEIKAEIQSASGDPVGYRIMGATIGIRKDQSRLIFIKDIKNI